jgi:hypothetical protein
MTEGKQLRAVLPLLKARVTARDDTSFTMSFGQTEGAPTTIRVKCNMSALDIRDGDLLTLYTEVLFKTPNQGPT